MMKGAFESEKTLYDFIPEYVARPVAFGTYQSLPDAHFYMYGPLMLMFAAHPQMSRLNVTCTEPSLWRWMRYTPTSRTG